MNVAQIFKSSLVACALIIASLAPAVACPTNLPLPFTPAITTLWINQVIFDPGCRYLYISNGSRVIDVLSLSTGLLEAPIVLTRPGFMDISPDGKTLFVITNSNAVSVVDLDTRTVTRRLTLPGDERLYVPPFYAAPQIYSVVVAHDETVFLSVLVGPVSSFETPTPWLLKASPNATRFEVVEKGGLAFKASRDRRVIYAGSYQGLLRYTAETGSFAPAGSSLYGLQALNADGSIGYTGGAVVARAAPLRLLGSLPRVENGESNAAVINSAGTIGFQIASNYYTTDAPGAVDVLDLKRFTRIGRLPVGAQIYRDRAVVGLDISPDDSMLAVNSRTSLILMRADVPESVDNRITVLSRKHVPLHSILRFHNTGTAAGRAIITLTNFDTGAIVKRWQSPEIPPNTSSEFYIANIEEPVGDPLALPLQYIATYVADFPGTVAHVTRQIGGHVMNASLCDTRVAAPNDVIANVNSTRAWPDNPSELRLTNTGKAAAKFNLAIFNTHNGQRLGSYSLGVVPASATRAIAMGQIEREVDLAPPSWLQQYTVKLEGSGTGQLQHLIFNVASGVQSDMTRVCTLAAL